MTTPRSPKLGAPSNSKPLYINDFLPSPCSLLSFLLSGARTGSRAALGRDAIGAGTGSGKIEGRSHVRVGEWQEVGVMGLVQGMVEGVFCQ
ncbi:MAG: hypothetical protein GDA56_03015 [Hormoscilla sp. GM7CHS1pb]|nr:hypothetical protein [Hormoscilla sp. GM7CHS1pb]